MVGLVFGQLGGAQNIGYIIPCEEIELFLQDLADGKYDGKPAMFDDLQTLEESGRCGPFSRSTNRSRASWSTCPTARGRAIR